jgi:uncharacterized protein YjbJ (UPF0337 family)
VNQIPRWGERSIHCQDKAMNEKQVKGRYEEAKGKMKEVAGHITGNESLELKGKLQKTAGKVQAGIGDVKKEIEDVTDGIKKDG